MAMISVNSAAANASLKSDPLVAATAGPYELLVGGGCLTPTGSDRTSPQVRKTPA